MEDIYGNEEIIKRAVREYYKIEDEEAALQMEKTLIYNLLN